LTKEEFGFASCDHVIPVAVVVGVSPVVVVVGVSPVVVVGAAVGGVCVENDTDIGWPALPGFAVAANEIVYVKEWGVVVDVGFVTNCVPTYWV
jgi:hypothetical protein